MLIQTKIEVHLLMSLLTAWCIFGGFIICFLPETAQQPKQETEEDG
jgi:hypothetical protein